LDLFPYNAALCIKHNKRKGFLDIADVYVILCRIGENAPRMSGFDFCVASWMTLRKIYYSIVGYNGFVIIEVYGGSV
jgi:hypothetical protein